MGWRTTNVMLDAHLSLLECHLRPVKLPATGLLLWSSPSLTSTRMNVAAEVNVITPLVSVNALLVTLVITAPLSFKSKLWIVIITLRFQHEYEVPCTMCERRVIVVLVVTVTTVLLVSMYVSLDFHFNQYE